MSLAWAALALCLNAEAKPPRPKPLGRVGGGQTYRASNGDFLIDLPRGWSEGEWSREGQAVFHFFKDSDRYGVSANLHADRRMSGYARPEEVQTLARKERASAEKSWAPVATTSELRAEKLANGSVAYWYYNIQPKNRSHLIGGRLWWAGRAYSLGGIWTDSRGMKPILDILATIRPGPDTKPLEDDHTRTATGEPAVRDGRSPAPAGGTTGRGYAPVEPPGGQSSQGGAIQIDDHKAAPLLR